MPRIRTIKPQHVADKELSNISLQAHLLWVLSWCFSDDEGVFENDPLLIKSQVFPRRTDVRVTDVSQWLDQLVKARFIIPFDHDGIGYYLHRTFKTHQKIDRPQGSKIPDSVIRRILDESSTNDRPCIVEESKVVVEESSAHAPPQDLIVFYDAEQLVLSNQIQLEKICLAAKKMDFEEVKGSLRKYHLYLEENKRYPMTKKQVFAGFEKWLLNEKNFNNGNITKKSVGKDLEFDRP